MKTVTIEIPDDCEVKIIKKEEKKEPIIRTYQDLIDNKVEITGCYIDTESSNIMDILCPVQVDEDTKDIATSEKVAKSMRAMAMISQLMPYYGGAVTDKEWDMETDKYIITRIGNKIKSDHCNHYHYLLAFHFVSQRDEFLKYNEQLVKDYLMVD